jgi:biotin synthase
MLDVQNAMTATTKEMAPPRWTSGTAFSLYKQPFNDLLFRAHAIHREHFDPNRVQLSRLLNMIAAIAASRRITQRASPRRN